MRFATSVCSAVLALGFAGAAPAVAMEPNWPTEPYHYTVVNQDLSSVLKTFGENLGIRTTISPAVKGVVKGTPTNASPKQFLDTLAQDYGFDWYYDGAVLSITATSEEQTQSVPLHGLSFEAARSKLEASGVLDSRFGFREGSSAGTAIVSGPPRYVALVSSELGVAPPADPNAQIIIHEGAGAVSVFSGPDFTGK